MGMHSRKGHFLPLAGTLYESSAASLAHATLPSAAQIKTNVRFHASTSQSAVLGQKAFTLRPAFWWTRFF